jgi:sugar phosphate isomerase/epimerase
VSLQGLSINLATVRTQYTLAQAVDACLAQGITAVAPWRDQLEAAGLKEAASIIQSNNMRVTSLCRGGMFAASDKAGLAAAIEDNKRAIDEAVTINAECLVLVVGGLPKGSRNLPAAREMIADGLAAILPYAQENRMPLAIEPLHPMYAADRACINTLEQALDVCELVGDGIGVAIDVYHVWWDPKLYAQIARAGASGRILAHHICDWLVPTRDMLLDRGMMGDGIIDLKSIRAAIEATGYQGPQEVEIFSSENWWKRAGEEVLATCAERFLTYCLLEQPVIGE